MSEDSEERRDVRLSINARPYRANIELRTTLADFIRDEAGLTGTKLGCEHGVCGACTVLVDDSPARSCLMLAVQAEKREVRTVESLAEGSELSRLQQAFRDHSSLQCGFCTSGFLMSATALLERDPDPTRADVVDAISGSLCRCTGYETIIAAIHAAATRRTGAGPL